MSFLLFAPLFGLVLLANLAPAGQHWRVLTLLVAAAFNALFLVVGLLFAAGGAIALPGLPEGADLGSTAILLVLTGILGFVLLLRRARALLYPVLRWNLDPDKTIHTVAVQLAVWAIGGMIASILLTRFVAAETLTAGLEGVSLSELWQQGAAFVIMAVLGVGLGLRRGWRETLERLGVGRLSWLQIALIPLIIFGLVLLQGAISAFWLWTDPGSAERISALAGALFGEGSFSLMGAATIGLSAGIGEELLMRGAVQPRFGIVFTTLLFAVLHTQYEFSLATVIVLLLGVVLGLVRHYFNTTACIAIHAGYNAVLVLSALAAQSFAVP